MVGDDDPQTQRTKHGRNESRPNTVDVHDFRPRNPATTAQISEWSKVSKWVLRPSRAEATVPRFHSLLRCRFDIRRTQTSSYAVSQVDELGSKVLDMRLNTTLNVRKASKPKDINLALRFCPSVRTLART